MNRAHAPATTKVAANTLVLDMTPSRHAITPTELGYRKANAELQM